MKSIDLGFCILQYGAAKTTKECVTSIIEKNGAHQIHIVIVDNCSPDDAFQDVQEEYKNRSDVDVIQTPDNIGFAKGNNFGIAFLHESFQCAYTVVLNNDIKFLEADLLDKLNSEFATSHFAVLGPMILTANGKFTSNPVRTSLLSEDGVKKRIQRERKLLKLYQWDALGVLNWLRQLRIRLHQQSPAIDVAKYTTRQERVQLHGSFLVFSTEFFKYYNGFDPVTYMYMEEYFLFKHLEDDKLVSVYLPDIHVLHLEDVSTDTAFHTNRKRELFQRKHSLSSAESLLRLYHQSKQQPIRRKREEGSQQ